MNKAMSRFGTVKGDHSDSPIEQLKIVSSNQIFSYAEWEEIRKAQGANFTDVLFPAASKSVVGNVKKAGFPKKLEELSKLAKSLEWKRTTEIDPSIDVMIGGIEPTDVIQGSLNNSYFLSALSALAEYQNRVSRLILQQEKSPNGAYGFAFNHAGNWKIVAVDDSLPFVKDEKGHTKLLGAHSVNSETWVSLLEKAYAKSYGGYDVIGNGGDIRHALTDLTGAPSQSFFLAEFQNETKIGGAGAIPYQKNPNSERRLVDNQNFSAPLRGDTRKKTLNSLGEIQPSVNLNQITNVDAAKQLWTLIKQADVNRHVICASTKDLEGIKNEYRAEFQEWKLNFRKE